MSETVKGGRRKICWRSKGEVPPVFYEAEEKEDQEEDEKKGEQSPKLFFSKVKGEGERRRDLRGESLILLA